MYVLDEGLSDGYLTARLEDAYYAGLDPYTVNVPFANGTRISGEPDGPINALNKIGPTSMTFTAGSAPTSCAILWNRMSDGTLVSKYASGLFISTAGSAPGLSEDSYTHGNSQHANTAGMSNGLYSWYQNATILGASYKVCVVDIGVNSTEYKSSSAKKYIADTSSSGKWGFCEGVDAPMFSSTDRYMDARMSSTSSYGTQTSSYRYSSGSQHNAGNLPFRLMAIPTGAAPVITPDNQSLGVVTEAPVIDVQLAESGASISVYVDGEYKHGETLSSASYSFDASQYWGDLGLGSHTVEFIAQLSGYKCGATASFTKSDSMLQVTGVAAETNGRAVTCTMRDTVTVPSGATITREVCNNAFDSNPTWEMYDGDSHAFANETKAASKWGVNWRITIDNSGGKTQAKIATGVGMGITLAGSFGEE